jgi:hypothetical protein
MAHERLMSNAVVQELAQPNPAFSESALQSDVVKYNGASDPEMFRL